MLQVQRCGTHWSRRNHVFSDLPSFRTLANPASQEREEHLAVSLASALSGGGRFRHEGLALIVRRATIAPEQGRCVGDGP